MKKVKRVWKGETIFVKCKFCKISFETLKTKSQRRKFCSKEHYYKHKSTDYLGAGNPFYKHKHTEEHKRKYKEFHPMKNPDNVRKAIAHTKPNKSEERIIKVCRDFNLPYKYCGNGQFLIENHCPDFVNINGEKKVIEVFGNWHEKPKRETLSERGRKKLFSDCGYKTLVLWTKDIRYKTDEEIANGIKNFGSC